MDQYDILAKLNGWNLKIINFNDINVIIANEKSSRDSILNEELYFMPKKFLQFRSTLHIMSFYNDLINGLIKSLSKSRNVSIEQYIETHNDKIILLKKMLHNLMMFMLKTDDTLSHSVHHLSSTYHITPKNMIYAMLFREFYHVFDMENDKVTDVDMLRFYTDDELHHIFTIEQHAIRKDEIKFEVYKKLGEIEKCSLGGMFDEYFLIDHEYDPFIIIYNKIHTTIGDTKHLWHKDF